MRTRAKQASAPRRGPFTYKLVLAYDGTNYAGWQIQPNRDTVQGRIEAVLAKIFGKAISVQGAGRTDAGVHAREQVASFRAGKFVEPATLTRALNAHLPEGIRVFKAALADAAFHARFSARSKEYRYVIVTSVVLDPFRRHHALHYPRKLEVAGMRRLSRRLVGRHDFAALSAKPQREVENTVRTISKLTIQEQRDTLTIAVRADGFLYKMVRSVVGALLKVGRGEATVEEMVRYVRGRKRTHFVESAPAHGLCLWKVWYQ